MSYVCTFEVLRLCKADVFSENSDKTRAEPRSSPRNFRCVVIRLWLYTPTCAYAAWQLGCVWRPLSLNRYWDISELGPCDRLMCAFRMCYPYILRQSANVCCRSRRVWWTVCATRRESGTSRTGARSATRDNRLTVSID